VNIKPNITIFLRLLPLIFFIIGVSAQAQFSSVTETSISNNNIRIDLTFDEEIYSVTGCSTPTCIEISDFNVTLSGGNATLASNTPITITKLGNFNFNPNWNVGEPNDFGAGDNSEDYAQHTAGSTMNDYPNTRNLNGLLEVINTVSQTITGYTWFATYPVGSACAHNYYRANTAKTWTDTKADATAAGVALGIPADLLVYNSQEEFDYLFNNHSPSTANTWIGLRQYTDRGDFLEPSGGWYWDDGTPIDNSTSKLK